MIKIPYNTQEEMNNIISEQTANGLYLIEIQNIIDGNYLIFDVNPLEENMSLSLDDRVSELERAVNTILLGGM